MITPRNVQVVLGGEEGDFEQPLPVLPLGRDIALLVKDKRAEKERKGERANASVDSGRTEREQQVLCKQSGCGETIWINVVRYRGGTDGAGGNTILWIR